MIWFNLHVIPESGYYCHLPLTAWGNWGFRKVNPFKVIQRNHSSLISLLFSNCLLTTCWVSCGLVTWQYRRQSPHPQRVYILKLVLFREKQNLETKDGGSRLTLPSPTQLSGSSEPELLRVSASYVSWDSWCCQPFLYRCQDKTPAIIAKQFGLVVWSAGLQSKESRFTSWSCHLRASHIRQVTWLVWASVS